MKVFITILRVASEDINKRWRDPGHQVRYHKFFFRFNLVFSYRKNIIRFVGLVRNHVRPQKGHRLLSNNSSPTILQLLQSLNRSHRESEAFKVCHITGGILITWFSGLHQRFIILHVNLKMWRFYFTYICQMQFEGTNFWKRWLRNRLLPLNIVITGSIKRIDYHLLWGVVLRNRLLPLNKVVVGSVKTIDYHLLSLLHKFSLGLHSIYLHHWLGCINFALINFCEMAVSVNLIIEVSTTESLRSPLNFFLNRKPFRYSLWSAWLRMFRIINMVLLPSAIICKIIIPMISMPRSWRWPWVTAPISNSSLHLAASITTWRRTTTIASVTSFSWWILRWSPIVAISRTLPRVRRLLIVKPPITFH